MFSHFIKKLIYSFFAFLLLSLGISLQIKAGIGQSMFNAFSMLWSGLFGIEIGTMINIFNLLFFIIYLIIKSSHPNVTDFVQILAIMINGFMINFFTYSIWNHIVMYTYLERILFFIAGLFLASLSLGAILAIGFIRFPLESLCIEMSQKHNYSLTKVRMGFDLFFLVSTLIFTFITNQPLYIREGTIISFFLLSRLIGFSYDFCKNIFLKGDAEDV